MFHDMFHDIHKTTKNVQNRETFCIYFLRFPCICGCFAGLCYIKTWPPWNISQNACIYRCFQSFCTKHWFCAKMAGLPLRYKTGITICSDNFWGSTGVKFCKSSVQFLGLKTGANISSASGIFLNWAWKCWGLSYVIWSALTLGYIFGHMFSTSFSDVVSGASHSDVSI